MPTITVDTRDLQEALKKYPLFPQASHSAMNAALNRTVTRVRTNIVKEVAKEYAVKTSKVKKTIDIKRSRINTLQAEAVVTDRRNKMGNFKFKFANNRNRSPVSVKIKNSSGFVRSTSNPALFQARGDIYHRTPQDRYPIGWAFTISTAQMVANDKVYEEISEDANKFLQERFQHELKYRIDHIMNK